jgi:4-hydroxy-3-polyprenylbenzoate decarboxylase
VVSRYFVGLTGGSGHAYAEALVRALCDAGHDVDLSVTEAGAKVLRHELSIDAGERGERLERDLARWLGPGRAAHVRCFSSDAVEAPPSSGTALTGGAIVCPCSMGTLARIAAGFSSNLVERAADVALKERRPLVLVPREAPYSTLHLQNMLELSRLGAIVLPASPGFYHGPRSVQDLVDHVAGKVLDVLRVEHSLGRRWQGLPRPSEDAGAAPRDGGPARGGEERRP